uniref:SH2 domain-containing protein n=1 Tax=Elaeophora elaphi TaxID=1147741 RepID=A0A158Q732_9BILA
MCGKTLADKHMYRRQVERGRRSRHGVVPMLERRTVWRDCNLSPTVEKNRYVTGNTFGCHQNRSGRRDNFTVDKMNESNSPIGRQRHRHRERLDNSNELSRSTTRISPTSVRNGPMESREYLEHELGKYYRGRDRLIAVDGAKSDKIRLLDEVNRNAKQVQSLEYGDSRMQNYHTQAETHLATEGISGKSNSLSNWCIEDLLGGQSMLNADSIQNAQTWITNDNSLSPAQIMRARELLQELLITITTKPDMPVTGRNVPTTMRQSIYIVERSFPEDRPSNFVTDRRVSEYTSSRFSQQNSQSPLRSDAAVNAGELSIIENSLAADVPLAFPAQNWRNDSSAAYSDSNEMPTSSRNLAKDPDFRMLHRCGSQNDYPTPYTENAEFGKRNAREHDPILLGSEKRRPHYHDRHRISRSRSRSLGKGCKTSIGERRVHMKSRGLISVEVNHLRKRSRRDYFSYEIGRSHHRENRGERNLRHSSPLIHTMRRHRR